MPRQQLLNNKIINNKKSMRREFVFPLIVGVLAGALIMMFWQFNARLNSASVALGQLEQASAQNTKTVSDVVAFINQATGANKQAANGAAATDTTTPSTK